VLFNVMFFFPLLCAFMQVINRTIGFVLLPLCSDFLLREYNYSRNYVKGCVPRNFTQDTSFMLVGTSVNAALATMPAVCDLTPPPPKKKKKNFTRYPLLSDLIRFVPIYFVRQYFSIFFSCKNP
jgi:hypothetical protein